MTNTTFATLVFFLFLYGGFCLQCYKCKHDDGDPNESCLKAVQLPTEPCDADCYQFTIKYRSNATFSAIQRGCTSEGYGSAAHRYVQRPDAAFILKTCSNNLCNLGHQKDVVEMKDNPDNSGAPQNDGNACSKYTVDNGYFIVCRDPNKKEECTIEKGHPKGMANRIVPIVFYTESGYSSCPPDSVASATMPVFYLAVGIPILIGQI